MALIEKNCNVCDESFETENEDQAICDECLEEGFVEDDDDEEDDEY